MPNNILISERLSYYQFGEERTGALREYYDVLISFIPSILNDFYEYVTTHSSSKGVFEGRNIEALKLAQHDHWRILLSGQFDEAYVERSVEIGKAHERIGITPFLFMGGYTFILTKLTDYALDACSGDLSKCKALIRAMSASLIMDMELALTSYASAAFDTKTLETSNKFADSMLDQNVSISMAVNEVAVENAHMLTSLQKVNNQAQSIAAAVEEMAVGISTISENSGQVTQNAENAQAETQKGKSIVEKTSENMHRVSGAVAEASTQVQSLEAKSAEIVDMVQTIDTIASQTNLLALNATIEAARAGEAGKGFAVVASEVKALANQTAKATVDIRQVIEALTGEINKIVHSMDEGAKAVAEGEESMNSAVASMDSISVAITVTTERMAEISGILTEQKSVATEVSHNVNSIASGTTKNVEALNNSIDATDSVVGLIGTQIGALSEFDVPNKSIRIAKSDHIVWKKRLANMVVGREALRPDELSSHLSCRLGKWYYGDLAEQYAHLKSFQELEIPHKIVHDCGISAVEKFNAGDLEGSLELLAKVDEASEDVIRLLDELIAAS